MYNNKLNRISIMEPSSPHMLSMVPITSSSSMMSITGTKLNKGLLPSFLILAPQKVRSLLIRHYHTTPIYNNEDSKHYPPANKEWTNSVYTYNTSSMVDSPFKDQMATNIINSYFDLVPSPKAKSKSERMRTLIRRSSTKQLFLSRPEIKQTNDKAIITLYVYDRQKQWLSSKIFYLNRWLKVTNFFNLFPITPSVVKENSPSFPEVKEVYPSISGTTSNITEKQTLEKYEGVDLSLDGLHNELPMRASDYHSNRAISSYINRINQSIGLSSSYLKTKFFYLFLRWALSIFRIKVITYIPRDKKGARIRNKNIRVILQGPGQRGKWIRTIFTSRILRIRQLHSVNMILLKYLLKGLRTLNKKHISQPTPGFISSVRGQLQTPGLYSINLLFSQFKDKYYSRYMRTQMKREVLGINYLSKVYLNLFKLSRYLPFLKTFLKKVYNKRIELNIVNLKYLHMNVDTLSQAITVKLRKKTNKLLRVLRLAIKLVKLPSSILQRNFSGYPVFGDNRVKVYRPKYKTKSALKTNVNFILNMVNYKWVTGARIEARGRLTQRFTASRALFKYKYKGNLRNLENIKANLGSRLPKYLYKEGIWEANNIRRTSTLNNLKQSPSVYMMRGEHRPNIQHTYVQSKRRVGAFGIKGWISGF